MQSHLTYIKSRRNNEIKLISKSNFNWQGVENSINLKRLKKND